MTMTMADLFRRGITHVFNLNVERYRLAGEVVGINIKFNLLTFVTTTSLGPPFVFTLTAMPGCRRFFLPRRCLMVCAGQSPQPVAVGVQAAGDGKRYLLFASQLSFQHGQQFTVVTMQVHHGVFGITTFYFSTSAFFNT